MPETVEPLTPEEIEEIEKDLDPTRIPEGAVPAGKLRGHTAYWCTQACSDTDCEFGPCCVGEPLFKPGTIRRLLATIAATEARAVAAEERADTVTVQARRLSQFHATIGGVLAQLEQDLCSFCHREPPSHDEGCPQATMIAAWDLMLGPPAQFVAAAETLINRYREALQEIIDFCHKTPGTYLGSIEQTARAALEDG